jgi:hypothetical protein
MPLALFAGANAFACASTQLNGNRNLEPTSAHEHLRQSHNVPRAAKSLLLASGPLKLVLRQQLPTLYQPGHDLVFQITTSKDHRIGSCACDQVCQLSDLLAWYAYLPQSPPDATLALRRAKAHDDRTVLLRVQDLVLES